jgi:nucleotide-binding universal stress UspA family protein
MKVLVGTTGDDRSREAVTWAIERARSTGDDVTVAVVDREAVADRIRDRLADAGLAADVRSLTGDPGSSLVELAEREGFDQLVIPGGDTSPMGKVDLDRLEEYVLLNARVTVTVVR